MHPVSCNLIVISWDNINYFTWNLITYRRAHPLLNLPDLACIILNIQNYYSFVLSYSLSPWFPFLSSPLWWIDSLLDPCAFNKFDKLTPLTAIWPFPPTGLWTLLVCVCRCQSCHLLNEVSFNYCPNVPRLYLTGWLSFYCWI